MTRDNEPTNRQGYRGLFAWQRGLELTAAVFRLSAGFPPVERSGMVGQLRTAAVAVPSRIAEAYERSVEGAHDRLLDEACAKVYQVEALAEVSVLTRMTDRADVGEVLTLAEETGRLITGLKRNWSRRRG
jgi:four helix bundle protein